ncbi:MAG: hypothetical protein ACKV2V_15875, partial [Blastocatellia bacterium]
PQQNLADDLVGVIDDIDATADLLARMRQASFPDVRGDRFTTCFDAALTLFQLPGNRGIQFIALLARELPDAMQRQALQGWITQANLGMAWPANIALAAVAPVSARHLMIELRPVSTDGLTFQLCSWLAEAGQPELIDAPETGYELAAAAAEIHTLAEAIYLEKGAGFTIELLVRRGVLTGDTAGRRALSQKLQQLVSGTPIVFRSLERCDARRQQPVAAEAGAGAGGGMGAIRERLARLRAQQQGGGAAQINLAEWQRKCETLRLRGQDLAEQIIHHLEQPEQDFETLKTQLKSELCVSLGFVPAAAGMGDALDAVFYTGIPMVIWFCEIPGAQSLDAQAMRQRLFPPAPAGVPLSGLSAHLWQLRKTAIEQGHGNDPGCHLSLIYDDYDRVPPPHPVNKLKVIATP